MDITSVTENPLQLLYISIEHSIDYFDYQNAILMAEIALAMDQGNQESIFLLAKANYLASNKKTAKSLLDGNTNHGPSVILYGTCCLELRSLQEGHIALTKWIETFEHTADPLEVAAVFNILGKMARLVGRINDTRENFEKSLTLDPLIIPAYQVLADIGSPIKVSDYLDHGKIEKTWIHNNSKIGFHAIKDKSNVKSTRSESGQVKRRAVEGKSTKSVSRAPLTSTTVKSAFGDQGVAVKKRSRENSKISEKKVSVDSIHQPLLVDLVSVLQKILTAYSNLASFNGTAAINLLNLLPINHYETPLVLGMIAKAHFEMHEYQKACDAFKKIRKSNPTQMEGMDLYATCLWHLKKKVELCSLGKELEDISKFAPQTWCVIGNYFSVLHEHDSAITAFKRAIQVDPYFTYAHTLMGHEYLSNEDMESAAQCFKAAVRIHHRHYNAIFGLGLIERKQEKYLLAEYYFRQALAIAPLNCILLDCLASVIQKDETRYQEALDIFDRALSLAPHQRIYALHRAQLLFSMEMYEDVVEVLGNEVRNAKPESSVYFLLGKAFAKLGQTQDAIMAMTHAQDYVEHKSSSIIKDAIEKLFLINGEEQGDSMVFD